MDSQMGQNLRLSRLLLLPKHQLLQPQLWPRLTRLLL